MSAVHDKLLKAVRRVYDDVGPPGDFGYETRTGKALANLYDVYNEALAQKRAQAATAEGERPA